MRTMGRAILIAILASTLLATLAMAQGAQTGGITGVIKDPSGAVIVNAEVQIYNEATGRLERQMVTGGAGTFTATLLPPGAYRIEVTAPGFKRYRVVDVAVRLAETNRIDVTMAIGVSQEEVRVEATSTLINTEAATTGQGVDARAMGALPLASPNFLFLLSLSPGTASEPIDVRSAGRGNVDINVNGQRTTNNSYSLEGINVNDFNLAHFDTVPLPSPDVIQEFKVATSLYDAASGSKGGGALGVSMKTGAKDWHWDAYWNHRNDALNATEWFTKFSAPATCTEFTLSNPNCRKGRLLQNVVGGTVSGPVKGLGGFFLGNYQVLRARNGVDTGGSIANPTVPYLPVAADGSTSAALLAARYSVNAASIDPIAVNILNVKNSYWGGTYVVPRSGQTGCATGATSFRCSFSQISKLQDDQYSFTYDRPLRSDKDKFSFRYFNDNFQGSLPYGLGGTISYPDAMLQRNRFYSLAYTTQISAQQLNEFRFGYSRFRSSTTPTDLVSLADIGATRPNQADFPGMYQVSITGLFSLGTGANDDRGTISNSFYWSDTWSYIKGKHTLRAGAEVIRYQLNRYNNFVTRGSVGFASTGTGSGTSCPPDCTPMQNFLLGRSTALQIASGDPQRYFRNTDLAFFFQDDWRILPRLTINLGMRWEGMGYASELKNRLANYDVARLIADPKANPFVYPSSLDLGGFTGVGGKVGNCTLPSCRDTNNWAPRVGFAWDIFGDKKTVLRGGYGIYYQRLSNQTTLQTNLAPPFNVQGIENRSDGLPAGSLANPWPNMPAVTLISAAVIPQASRFAGVTGNINASTGTPIFINDDGQRCSGFGGTAGNCSINLASFTAPPMDFHTPYNQQWNLTLQRELWRGWAVEGGYVGAHYLGGLGIYNPYVRMASPTNPITVTDIYGVSYTITTNTAANEPLRSAVLGISRAAGARFGANIGFANYHSAQVTVSHRFERGLFFQTGYTWAHTIDNVSGSMSTDEMNATRNGQSGANLYNLGNINPALNKANGDFDRRHRLVVSYSYDLPIPKRSLFGSQAFQGWAISGITYFQSGLPFSITTTASGAYGGGSTTPTLLCAALASQIATLPTCTPGAVTTTQEALLTGDVQDRINNYINPNMFSANSNAPFSTASDYGNVPRNSFRGPFQQNWDFAVTKRFKLLERHTLSFRADFFNLWNQAIFRAPSTVSIGTRSTFGQITQTAVPARLIQFGLRYEH